MYVHPRVSSVVQPVLRLAGFERLHLRPGESKSVAFSVGPEQLAVWNRVMKRVVEPGLVDVFVGPNSNALDSVSLEVRQ
jgi:beta-glucosidase